MGLYLIHGEHHLFSRQKLSQLIDQYKRRGFEDIVRLEGKKVTEGELIQALESGSFFGGSRLTVIENLHQHPSKTVKAKLLDYLSGLEPDRTELILWEGKKLTPSQLKKLVKFNQEEFKAGKKVFLLLESIVPGNQRRFLPLYKEACREESAEFVFFLLARHIRNLLLSGEPKAKFPDWQRRKLRSQANRFDEKRLAAFYTKLADLDWEIKSGQNILDLESNLEMALLNL